MHLRLEEKAISPCFIIPTQSRTYANPAYPHSPASDIWPTQIHTHKHTPKYSKCRRNSDRNLNFTMHMQACSCMNSLYLMAWEWTCTTDLCATLIKWVTLQFKFLLLFLSHRHTQFVTQRAMRARGMNMTNQESEEKRQSERKEEKWHPA